MNWSVIVAVHSKKLSPLSSYSDQTLSEKTVPSPITQAIKPKKTTPFAREKIFSSSIQAVKGSIKETEELKAAIETKIKNIE